MTAGHVAMLDTDDRRAAPEEWVSPIINMHKGYAPYALRT